MASIIRPPGQERPYPPPTRSGKVPFSYEKNGMKGETAYWIWGDLSSSSRIPLICMHGGPGAQHNYLLPTSLLWQDYGIPVVLYDQIGCGESTRFRETKGDHDFWTPQLFMAEFENLKDNLGIKTYDLLGQSWGGMLASQYAVERQPKDLRKLIIADSPSDMRVWVEVQNRFRAQLPKDVQEVLDRCERENKTETPEYEAAVMQFYSSFLCRLDPWPQELQASLGGLMEDSTVYYTMNGPSEFYVIGNLKEWSIIKRLGEITEQTVPGGMLVMNGHFDEAQDECVEPYFERVKCRVKWVRYAMSGHMPMLEETERYVADLGRFLGRE